MKVFTQEEFFKKLGYGEVSFNKKFILCDDISDFYSSKDYLNHMSLFLLKNKDIAKELMSDAVRTDGHPLYMACNLRDRFFKALDKGDYYDLNDLITDKNIDDFKMYIEIFFISLDEVLDRIAWSNLELIKEASYLTKDEYDIALIDDMQDSLKNYARLKKETK